ncbi:hypothetical protein CDD82_741 [Ophiocordyceps australis]|uniref:Uncharacterized protein n=1 Tax=Ophiocordyceps australis TaxID=1399860 RepID=A0A2C5ZQ64_9HYPO|nr:hypothetical protein CDD82_741 [Ophiocordyceps australis]
MAAPDIVIFTGAPPAQAVEVATCTVTGFDEAFASLLALPAGPRDEARAHAAWRLLPLSASTGSRDDFWRQADDSTTFDEATWTQFCHESLGELHHQPHDNHDPGCHAHDHDDLDETTDLTIDLTTDTAAIAPSTQLSRIRLSSLAHVPPPRHIVALQPQTMTLNLVVGVLSISQPRIVTTRWRQTLRLVELLVADDAASGFAVTFWLPRHGAAGAVDALRRQDVVLLENVALHVFDNKVYGQSLRRNLTRVALLWRSTGQGARYHSRILDSTHAAKHPLLLKTRQVRDWILSFVAPSKTPTTSLEATSWDRPPDDTPQT